MNLFKYDTGMYGGCFDPPTTGHLSVIYRAATECRRLFLVVSWSRRRDSVPYETRLGWLKEMVSHLPNVITVGLEDDCLTKAEYDTDEHWRKGAETVKRAVGRDIDAVYCSDEYDRPDSPYRKFYPGSELVFVDRSAVPCSSTAVRMNPYANWDYIPNPVKPRYVKKVLVIGNESTGKSTLTRMLAGLFCTEYVPEYGREVCEARGGEDFMTERDFVDIARTHAARIDAAVKRANKVMFADTDAFTTSYYASLNANVRRDSAVFDTAWLSVLSRGWDLVIFLESDVPYIRDGVRVDARNSGPKRALYTSKYEKIYTDAGFKITRVGGPYGERLAKSAELVRKLLAPGG